MILFGRKKLKEVINEKRKHNHKDSLRGIRNLTNH